MTRRSSIADGFLVGPSLVVAKAFKYQESRSTIPKWCGSAPHSLSSTSWYTKESMTAKKVQGEGLSG